MSDLISRQAAIDALGKDPGFKVRLFGKSYDEGRSDQWFRDVYKLTTLPPAQPERKKGKWIDYTEDGYVECPFCHNATNCDGNKDELHFCFSCGADMRGERDD